jgi:cytochrome P450
VVCGLEFAPGELEEWSALYGTVARGIEFPVPLEALWFTPFGKAMRARREVVARLQARVDAERARLAAAGGGGRRRAAGGMLAAMVAARDPETGQGLTDQQLTDNLLGLLVCFGAGLIREGAN